MQTVEGEWRLASQRLMVINRGLATQATAQATRLAKTRSISTLKSSNRHTGIRGGCSSHSAQIKNQAEPVWSQTCAQPLPSRLTTCSRSESVMCRSFEPRASACQSVRFRRLNPLTPPQALLKKFTWWSAKRWEIRSVENMDTRCHTIPQKEVRWVPSSNAHPNRFSGPLSVAIRQLLHLELRLAKGGRMLKVCSSFRRLSGAK
jgi:hypothetical protein